MIRDIRKDIIYWDKWIDYDFMRVEKLKKELAILRVERPQFEWECLSDLICCYKNLLLCCYSRGDSIKELVQYFKPLLDYWEQYEIATAKKHEENDWYRTTWSVNLNTYIACFWWVGLALALEVPDDQWQRLLKLIGNEGEDELLDRIIATRQKNRKIGAKLCHPKPYQLLLDAINAPKEQQAQKLFLFVDNWYKQLGDKKKPYIPKGMMKYPSWHGCSSCQGLYFGYWCIEAVAAVKAFNLDDSLCLGHKNYPGDLLRPDDPTTHKDGMAPKCDKELIEQEKIIKSFLAAAETGDMDAVNKFIQDGMDVNAEDKDGRTALLLACINKNNQMATKLLEYGADANLDNMCQYSALTHVIDWANKDLLKKMLDKGANPNDISEDGSTPLIRAAYSDNADYQDMIQMLVEYGAKVNQIGCSTPLIEAARSDCLENVKLLIKIGADLNKKTKEEGDTALIFASGLGRIEVVKELIKAGADLNIKNKYGDTALQIVNKIIQDGYYEYDALDDMNVAYNDGYDEIKKILRKHEAR